jgi:hypothetical protein
MDFVRFFERMFLSSFYGGTKWVGVSQSQIRLVDSKKNATIVVNTSRFMVPMWTVTYRERTMFTIIRTA